MHDDRHLPYVCDHRQMINKTRRLLVYNSTTLPLYPEDESVVLWPFLEALFVTPSCSPAPSFALVKTDSTDEALERDTDRRLTKTHTHTLHPRRCLFIAFSLLKRHRPIHLRFAFLMINHPLCHSSSVTHAEFSLFVVEGR